MIAAALGGAQLAVPHAHLSQLGVRHLVIVQANLAYLGALAAHVGRRLADEYQHVLHALALLEQELIVGEELPFGLYVTEVNGMRADYDLDKAYWMLTVGGVPAATGVDGTEVTAGECYAFVYTEA